MKELVMERILVAEKETSYGQKLTLREYKVLEVAPSGKYVKLMDMDGRRYWRIVSDITVIEPLTRASSHGG